MICIIISAALFPYELDFFLCPQAAIQGGMPSTSIAVIAGLANEYADYITTFEEYQVCRMLLLILLLLDGYIYRVQSEVP